MKNIIYIISLSAFATLVSCNNTSQTNGTTTTAPEVKSDSTKTAAVYQCPMDCEKGKTYDKPGKCPVCEMDLEKLN